MGRTPEEFRTNKAFCAVLSHIHLKNWSGACHASTGVLVALLRALGVNAEPYLGECQYGIHYFDHSWVEINGEIYDGAISNSLIEGFFCPPVYRGIDLETKKETSVKYGVTSGVGYDTDAAMIRQVPFAYYMEGFPNHPQGLWGLASDIAKQAGVRLSPMKLKKYCDGVSWKEK